MASPAHCAYCFDVLISNLGGPDHAPLDVVLASWDEYTIARGSGSEKTSTSASTSAGDGGPLPILEKGLPALRRLAEEGSQASLASASASSTSSETAASSAPSGVSTPGTSVSSLPPAATPASPSAEYPLFVTWNTLSDDAGTDDDDNAHELRGCIGTFEAHALSEGLADFAQTAAFEDHRFPPIEARELPKLQCAVTLLTDFEDAADAMDWTIGEHGLRISFVHRGRRYGATYLPNVAPEQGWDKEKTIVSLMRKAGWEGSRSRWRDVELKVVRYKGKKADLTYAEYEKWVAWRGWK